MKKTNIWYKNAEGQSCLMSSRIFSCARPNLSKRWRFMATIICQRRDTIIWPVFQIINHGRDVRILKKKNQPRKKSPSAWIQRSPSNSDDNAANLERMQIHPAGGNTPPEVNAFPVNWAASEPRTVGGWVVGRCSHFVVRLFALTELVVGPESVWK